MSYLAKAVASGVHSKRAEKREAAALGGRRVRGSGNKRHAPGDISLRNALGEHKFTVAGSYQLKLSVLRKIGEEAARMRKRPFMAIEFRSAPGAPGETFFVFPADVVRWLLARRGAE